MKINHAYTKPGTMNERGDDNGLWNRLDRSQNIMIPIELDRQDKLIGFYPVTNRDLPEGGQNNLNEITGTPFKADLAGMTVIASPVKPDIKESYIKALISLADSIDQCDHSRHSQVSEFWARKLAEQVGLPEIEVEQISLAAKLHDIGKAVMSKEMLTKTGLLNESEWIMMKKHPGYSAALMEPSSKLNPIRSLVRWHHERIDGNGYPDGLDGSNIPLGARILSIADAFSTMTNGRVYRKPIPCDEALAELTRCSGSQFDQELVKLMLIVAAVA